MPVEQMHVDHLQQGNHEITFQINHLTHGGKPS